MIMCTRESKYMQVHQDAFRNSFPVSEMYFNYINRNKASTSRAIIGSCSYPLGLILGTLIEDIFSRMFPERSINADKGD